MSTKQKEASIDLMLELTKEFENESDRSAAVLAGGYLDHLLGDLIATAMVVGPKEVDDLLYADGQGPLGTFRARVDTAYCMGLISKDEYRDLHLIRKIRNDFAHELIGLSFETPSIACRCGELVGAKKNGRPSTGRERFKKATVRLMVDMILRIRSNKNKQSRSGKASTN